MGLEHPGTGILHIFRLISMGNHNSPGASGKVWAALLRLIINTSDFFNGTSVGNSIHQYFSNKLLHPKFEESRVLFGTDRLPAVLLWLHVDDILIHTLTLGKLETALDLILQTIVRLGLICHCSKTDPPSQRVKFCGFKWLDYLHWI